MWNFFGIVNNTGDGTIPAMRPKAMTTYVNFIISRDAETTNRWGSDLIVGTTLYFILKKMSRDSPFRLIPYYSLEGETPSPADLFYEDYDGSIQFGHPYLIGTVKYSYMDKVSFHDRNMANGLDDTGEGVVSFSDALEKKINIAKEEKLVVLVKD
jgi:hypothetical protein